MDPREASLAVSVIAPESSTPSLNLNKTTPLVSTLNQLYYVKLDRANYLLWQSIVMATIKGNKLEGYVLSTKPCPTKFFSDDAEKKNLAYEEWVSMIGWLFNTMIVLEITSEMISCKTS